MGTHAFRAAVATAALGLTMGCHRPTTTSWATGYKSPEYHYQLGFFDRPTASFLPATWRIDNYDWNPKDRTYTEKRLGKYSATRHLDIDGDGEISAGESSEEPLYDLHFVSTRDNGTIWLKAHPILFRNKDKELSVVLDNYVDSLAGRGLYTQGSLFSTEVAKTREFVTFVRDQRSTSVDGQPAVEAVIELAEAEKVKIEPTYRSEKIKVVFVRFPYSAIEDSGRDNPGWPEETVTLPRRPGTIYKAKRRQLRRQALLVLGYANSASRFDGLVGDFDEMRTRVWLSDRPAGESPAATPAVSTPAGSATGDASPAAPAGAPAASAAPLSPAVP